MPTRHPRVNVVLEPPLYDAVRRLAKRDGLSVSSKVRHLVSRALEMEEDVMLAALAERRLAKDPAREMTYRLLYHPAVADDDPPRIPKTMAGRIARAIETRLAEHPERFGILAIRHRRDVSEEAAARRRP